MASTDREEGMGSNSNTLRQADGFVLLITTTSSRREADLIADGLVGGGLAACVNVVQVDSTYKWKGQVERAGEFMLFCKTRADLTDRAAEKIRGIHSYEVPEIIVIPIQKGSAPYLEWLGETLAKTKLA